MTASEIAAWVGATTGAASFCLQVNKHFRSGPVLRVRACPSLVEWAESDEDEVREPSVLVRVVNVGEKPALIHHLTCRRYDSQLGQALGRYAEQTEFHTGEVSWSLSTRLEPWESWSARVKLRPAPVLRPGERLVFGVQEQASGRLHLAPLRFFPDGLAECFERVSGEQPPEEKTRPARRPTRRSR